MTLSIIIQSVSLHGQRTVVLVPYCLDKQTPRVESIVWIEQWRERWMQ